MKKDKIYIYCIYFPTNNKYYVGQTNNLKRRMYEHLSSGSLVCKALLKVNNWIVSILHTCKIRDEASRIEIEEIRNFNSVVPNGYNLTAGGEGSDYWKGRKRSKESIEKMKKNLPDRHGENNSMYGTKGGFVNKKHSKEWCKDHSKKMQGNKNGQGRRSEKSKKKMQIAQIKNAIKKYEQGGVS